MMIRTKSLLYYVIVVQGLSTFMGSIDAQGLQIYWNVPTFMCRQYGIHFDDISKNFGIIQNNLDEFRGRNIAILYDPGMFPALIKNPNGSITVRNGGVPQEGNLDIHLQLFKKHLEQQIDPGFFGLGVIDFESWRPLFRQNWASLSIYRDKSIEIEQRNYPLMPNALVKQLATKKFEESGRIFMEQTLLLARKLRPYARWSYYAYPYCFNMSPNQRNVQCDQKTEEDNNKLSWLWTLESALMPSVYLFKALTPAERMGLIAGRVYEAQRLRQKYAAPILPYWWFKYHDQRDSYLTQDDVFDGFRTMMQHGVDGWVIWGSSTDLNSRNKCQEFLNYFRTVLGPAINNARSFNYLRSMNASKEMTVTQLSTQVT